MFNFFEDFIVSKLAAAEYNLKCGGGSEKTITYASDEVKDKLYKCLSELFAERLSAEEEAKLRAEIEEKSKEASEKSLEFGEDDAILLLKKYKPMPTDFFETALPSEVLSAFLNGNKNTLSPEEIFFWWYAERMRFLMFLEIEPRFSATNIYSYLGAFTEQVKHSLPTEKATAVFAEVIRYEKQNPFNIQKFKEIFISRFAGEEYSEIRESVQALSEEAFAAAREKIIGAFENDLDILRNLKEGQTFEEAVKEKNGLVDYQVGLTMHPLYPVEPFFTILKFDEDENLTRDVSAYISAEWTFPIGGINYLAANDYPLPAKIDTVYYSIAEDAAYSLEADLPKELIKEKLSAKTESGENLYGDLIFGLGPNGSVSLWTKRNDNYQAEFLGAFKGEKIDLPYDNFSQTFHKIGGANWQEFRENALNTYGEAAENLEKNGLPEQDLIEQFNEKYSYGIKIDFKAAPQEDGLIEDIQIEEISVKYFNGETEKLTEQEAAAPKLRAKPLEINIHFKDLNNKNSSYLYVDYKTWGDNRSSREVFQKVFGENTCQAGLLMLSFNGAGKPWSITLRAGENTAEVPFEEIRFRNNFESYRTPVYYQPHSFWKGQQPTEEEKIEIPSAEEINNLDENGETPLTKAVSCNDEEKFKALLAAGADINVKNARGNSPLFTALLYNQDSFAKDLLKAGADINCTGDGGHTPLMEAAMNGNIEIVKLLLSAGADVNAELIIDGLHTGETALNIALENGQTEIADLLRENGAMELSPKEGYSRVEMPRTEKVNDANEFGYPPLMMALMSGDIRHFNELIKSGADVNAKAPAVGTPLLFACTMGNIEAVNALISAKADLNAAGETGYTPLMMACQTGNKELAQILVSAGADVNAPLIINGQDMGMTALSIAQNGGFTEVAELLKAAGGK